MSKHVIDWTHTTAAIKKAERRKSEGRWKTGDELCREAPDDAGLRACAKELKQLGYSITVNELRKWRDTAAAFPLAQRRPDLTFDIHAAAGDPEMLQRVLAKLPRGWPVSPTRVGWAAATLRGAPPVASFPACVSPVAGTGHALGGGHRRNRIRVFVDRRGAFTNSQ